MPYGVFGVNKKTGKMLDLGDAQLTAEQEKLADEMTAQADADIDAMRKANAKTKKQQTRIPAVSKPQQLLQQVEDLPKD